MTPELIGILAVGATIIGLLLTFWRDARADIQKLRAEVRAEVGGSSQGRPGPDRARVPPRRRHRRPPRPAQ